jgi:hypothetical protein
MHVWCLQLYASCRHAQHRLADDSDEDGHGVADTRGINVLPGQPACSTAAQAGRAGRKQRRPHRQQRCRHLLPGAYNMPTTCIQHVYSRLAPTDGLKEGQQLRLCKLLRDVAHKELYGVRGAAGRGLGAAPVGGSAGAAGAQQHLQWHQLREACGLAARRLGLADGRLVALPVTEQQRAQLAGDDVVWQACRPLCAVSSEQRAV